MRLVTALLAGLLSLAVQAAPATPASLDRGLWPEQLDSPALFDVASRAEILSFARVLHENELLDENTLAARLGLRQVNVQKVRQVRARLWQRLWQGYQQAQRSCEQDASFCYAVTSMAELRLQAASFATDVGEFYTGWIEPSRQFHEQYLNEQLRKAALLPQTSSEVQRLSAAERNGDELNDRLFLLTFAGGPGAAAGTTDALTAYLRKQKLDGTFFVLGSRLQQRRDGESLAALRRLYKGAVRRHSGVGVPVPRAVDGLAGLDQPQPGTGAGRPARAVRAAVSPALWPAAGRRPGLHAAPAVAGLAVGYRCAGRLGLECAGLSPACVDLDAAMAQRRNPVS